MLFYFSCFEQNKHLHNIKNVFRWTCLIDGLFLMWGLFFFIYSITETTDLLGVEFDII